MLYLYKSIHLHAGGRIQSGCPADKLRKYAEYEDMVIAGEYSDEGFSGKNIQGRQEFQRMLSDIQDCKDGISLCTGVQALPLWKKCGGCSELLAADAGFWCQPDLRGGWH